MAEVTQLYRFLKNHMTKVLGIMTGVISAVSAVPGVIPEDQLKYWMAVMAVLIYLRGQFSPVQPQKQP